MIQTDNILISLMNRKTYNNVKIFIIALTLCLIAVPVSRYLSPRAIVNGHDVYLAWLPLSVMLAVILLFGRRAILPILLGFTVTNLFYINLAPLQYSVLLFCQTFALFAACVRTCPTKALILVNIRDIARTSKRKRELTINTDVGDLSLLRAFNEGAK